MAEYVRDLSQTPHMMGSRQFLVANVDLAAGDSTKTVIAAPAAGVRIRIFHTVYISKTSAAQALALACGTLSVLDLAASVTAHTVIDTGWTDGGQVGPAATALIATPAAAGPAGKFIVTFTLE